MRRVTWTSAVLALVGCAPAMPALSGGSTVIAGHTDIGAGGAARVPVGAMRDLDPETSRYRSSVENGGLVPVAFARVATRRGEDIGILAAGPVVRLEYRREIGAREGSTRPTWIVGVAPIVGAIADDDGAGRGARVGLELPVVYGVEIGGLYEVWVGARVGVDHAWGDFLDGADVASARATTLKAGAVLGLALGFRRVHAFIEVTGGYEGWFVDHGGRDLTRHGFVLTPAFGLRLRL